MGNNKWASITAAESIKTARQHGNKDIRKVLIRLVKEQDARIYSKSGKHIVVLHPDGKGIVTVSVTPSDKFVGKKVARDLRVHGHFDKV